MAQKVHLQDGKMTLPEEVREMFIAPEAEDLDLIVEKFLVSESNGFVVLRPMVIVANRDKIANIICPMATKKTMHTNTRRGLSKAVLIRRMGQHVNLVCHSMWGQAHVIQDDPKYHATRKNHLAAQILVNLTFADGRQITRIGTEIAMISVDITAYQDDANSGRNGCEVTYGDDYVDVDPEQLVKMDAVIDADTSGSFAADIRWRTLMSKEPTHGRKRIPVRLAEDGSNEEDTPEFEDFHPFAPKMQTAYDDIIRAELPIIFPRSYIITTDRLVRLQSLLRNAVDRVGLISPRSTTRYPEQGLATYGDGKLLGDRWDGTLRELLQESREDHELEVGKDDDEDIDLEWAGAADGEEGVGGFGNGEMDKGSESDGVYFE
ncbi:hypothetical protein DOTSEDRAFT_39626 [Dothistroma septosporum NZE10]|uniref:Uncharacterized protein n=1 Tax=Dothistroma septosporum (strain NZE10 / CBS 128990) TaxID=675120 RepID=M2YHW0_DOTSN|nr:hypothetical protein DOTSEDRAFT_39626 [Dothistroma septosporum NZE10]